VSIDRLYQYKPGKNSVTEPRVFHYFRQRPSTPVVEEEGLSHGSLIEIEARGVERYTTYACIYKIHIRILCTHNIRKHAQDHGMSFQPHLKKTTLTKLENPCSIVHSNLLFFDNKCVRRPPSCPVRWP
jgi:hypothetical protein